MTDEGWAEQRDRAIAVRAADLARREATDTAQARELLRDFVARTTLPPVPLSARPYGGKHRYRTGLRGWYLRADEALAVGEDAEFYILTVPASMKSRLTGVHLTPDRPRTIIGEGGRDGERVALKVLLDALLNA